MATLTRGGSVRDENPNPDQELQFDHAEPGEGDAAGPTCAVCHEPIVDQYYEAAGKTVCPSCRDQVAAANVQGVAASGFLRAGLFGLVGAIGGALVYYAVLALTGYEVGLIAILVGFMVGYGVRLGAGGLGGRRYQALAVLLTYLAIGGTYVPLALRGWNEATAPGIATATDEPDASAKPDVPAPTEPANVAPAGEPDFKVAPAGDPSPGVLDVIVATAALAALAAALPIMVIVFGFPDTLISALIIGFALHQAWRMNGRLKVHFSGPFTLRSPSAGAAPGA